jgi:regulatory LuxR family protein
MATGQRWAGAGALRSTALLLLARGDAVGAAAAADGGGAIFEDVGAGLWLPRVEQELRRARPRPRRNREFTNVERRVAALVADGKTNREVAAELFATVATVEAHLTRSTGSSGLARGRSSPAASAMAHSRSPTSGELSGFPRRRRRPANVRSLSDDPEAEDILRRELTSRRSTGRPLPPCQRS